ncbi:hypothetical protein BDV59DRAFT_182284 [Aspergillus ambiguus]|uniref:uncharacterized protein n=1 Tax=Aspergillus ambiguus TaxID=176160 RepID=UPI003CCDE548
MATSTLEFASACEPEVPIDCIEICKTSTMETVRTEPHEGFAGNVRFVMCENHWTIVFKYGREEVTATKHRGYDLKWRQNTIFVPPIPPSVILKFDTQPYCPSMSDIAWRICASEYPHTKELDCIQFV